MMGAEDIKMIKKMIKRAAQLSNYKNAQIQEFLEKIKNLKDPVEEVKEEPKEEKKESEKKLRGAKI